VKSNVAPTEIAEAGDSCGPEPGAPQPLTFVISGRSPGDGQPPTVTSRNAFGDSRQIIVRGNADDADDGLAPTATSTAARKFCFAFQNKGACRHGDNCRYAHVPNGDGGSGGDSKVPDVDATGIGPGNEGKFCFAFQNKGACRHGDNCRYAHVPKGDAPVKPGSKRGAGEGSMGSALDQPLGGGGGGKRAKRAEGNPTEMCPDGARGDGGGGDGAIGGSGGDFRVASFAELMEQKKREAGSRK